MVCIHALVPDASSSFIGSLVVVMGTFQTEVPSSAGVIECLFPEIFILPYSRFYGGP